MSGRGATPVAAAPASPAGGEESLRELGCDLGQGYLLSPPLPPDEVERVLSESGPERARLRIVG